MSYLAEPIQKKKRSLLDSEQSEFALASDQVSVTNAQKHVARNVKEVRQSHYVTKKRCRVAKNTGNDLDNKPDYVCYFASVLARLAMEILFIVLQVVLFGLTVPEFYKCQRWPCPNVVDCFISRPKEKTYFLWFLLLYSCLCGLEPAGSVASDP